MKIGKLEENGDLGRGHYIVPSELSLICQVVNNFFESLPKEYYYYGVEINPLEYSSNTASFERLLTIIVDKYKNLALYEVDGKKIFQVRGVGGGIENRWIFYLVQHA